MDLYYWNFGMSV